MANLYSPAESLSLNNENSILQYVLKRTFFFLFPESPKKEVNITT